MIALIFEYSDASGAVPATVLSNLSLSLPMAIYILLPNGYGESIPQFSCHQNAFTWLASRGQNFAEFISIFFSSNVGTRYYRVRIFWNPKLKAVAAF